MTTIGIQLGLFSGQTNLTLWLFNNGVLLNTGGDTLTEVGTSGFFQATVAESITTSLSVVVRQAGVLVYEGVLLIGQTVVDHSPVLLSTSEVQQLRHRLGIDGTKATPASSNPNLGNVEMSRLIINNTTPGQAAIYIGANNATVIEYEDTDQSFAASFNPEIGYTLVGGALLPVRTQQIVANAIGSDQLAASAITEIQTGLATTSQLTTVQNIAATIEGNMATDAKQDHILDAIANIEVSTSGTGEYAVTFQVRNNGNAVQGAKISIFQGATFLKELHTGSNGNKTYNLDAGNYTINVTATGYEAVSGQAFAVDGPETVPTSLAASPAIGATPAAQAIDVKAGVDFSQVLTITIPNDWQKVIFTAKNSTADSDNESILQIQRTNGGHVSDGVVRLLGAAGAGNQANGSLTVSLTSVTIDLKAALTTLFNAHDDRFRSRQQLASGSVWHIQVIRAGGQVPLVVENGTFTISRLATRATS